MRDFQALVEVQEGCRLTEWMCRRWLKEREREKERVNVKQCVPFIELWLDLGGRREQSL